LPAGTVLYDERVRRERDGMKSHPILAGFAVLLLAICGAAVVFDIWDHLHPLYPISGTESAFLKNYKPTGVFDRFSVGHAGSYGQHSGGGAGREFVTHTAGFEGYFPMRSEKWMPLMNALRDDVSAQLVGYGAQILSQNGDSREGFHFDYKLGKSVGTVTIVPLAINSLIHRNTPLPKCMVDVTAQIEQTETWFPEGQGTITASVNVNLH
jgi:hypothetical protein